MKTRKIGRMSTSVGYQIMCYIFENTKYIDKRDMNRMEEAKIY